MGSFAPGCRGKPWPPGPAGSPQEYPVLARQAGRLRRTPLDSYFAEHSMYTHITSRDPNRTITAKQTLLNEYITVTYHRTVDRGRESFQLDNIAQRFAQYESTKVSVFAHYRKSIVRLGG